MNENFNEKGSTVNLKWSEINLMAARGDFTQANSILLLARIIKELVRCYKYLKTQLFACLLSY